MRASVPAAEGGVSYLGSGAASISGDSQSAPPRRRSFSRRAGVRRMEVVIAASSRLGLAPGLGRFTFDFSIFCNRQLIQNSETRLQLWRSPQPMGNGVLPWNGSNIQLVLFS
jgi:hypothetical protein